MEHLNEFAAKFQAQYIDADQIEIKPNTEFRQIGTWDSLTGMAVLVMIEDEYGVNIPVEKFREMKTVKDVYSYVLSNNV